MTASISAAVVVRPRLKRTAPIPILSGTLMVVCFAHVTNTMAQTEGDFEKGDADGPPCAAMNMATADRQ
jgi:hypothetical protein